METETRPYVAWDLMNSFMIDVFKCYGVPVGESIQKELIGLRDKFNLPYKFPFEA